MATTTTTSTSVTSSSSSPSSANPEPDSSASLNNDNIKKDSPTSTTNSDSQQTGPSNDTSCSNSAFNKMQEDIDSQRLIELEEERKLKARNPCVQRPGSEFLQKRLQRGLKYFDSGDYNMAKASTNPNVKLPDGRTPMPTIDSKILSKRH